MGMKFGFIKLYFKKFDYFKILIVSLNVIFLNSEREETKILELTTDKDGIYK